MIREYTIFVKLKLIFRIIVHILFQLANRIRKSMTLRFIGSFYPNIE